MALLLPSAVIVVALLCAGTADAQRRERTVDFLNERLSIPDSDRFKEADYTESGIGLRFGVDKKLSYFSGQYAEAVQRFEEAVSGYPYKAEIWVFLARSYFYERSPDLAKKVIERAAATMPDLAPSFWDPLLASMLGEIRKRALNMQTQVDFYSKSQDDFLTLFRLYLFLEDEKGMAGVIGRAEAKSSKMSILATMVSAESRRRYSEETDKWDRLAEQLRDEMLQKNHSVPEPLTSPNGEINSSTAEDVELLDRTRFLQLKVDFYQPQVEDFSELFENYLLLDLAEGAQGVLDALDREVIRVQFQADTATDFVQESQFTEKIEQISLMKVQFSKRVNSRGVGP
jgi:tetratricopeptide (TPR) repeat protein